MGESKDYEIVQGTGKDLKISNTETHINDMIKKKKKNVKNVIIPKVKNKSNEEENKSE